MQKYIEIVKKFWETMKSYWVSMKSKSSEYPAVMIFTTGILGVMLAVHFVAGYMQDKEVAVVEPTPIVEQAPAQAFKPIPYPAVVEQRPSGASQGPFTVKIVQTPAVVQEQKPGQPAVAQAPQTVEVQVTQTPEPEHVRPKEIPPELRLTPENIRKLQNLPQTDGDDDFDVDFDAEPEKASK